MKCFNYVSHPFNNYLLMFTIARYVKGTAALLKLIDTNIADDGKI